MPQFVFLCFIYSFINFTVTRATNLLVQVRCLYFSEWFSCIIPVVVEQRGHQMAAVITEDDVYSDAEMNGAPPAAGDDQLQLPGPEGNIQGQVTQKIFFIHWISNVLTSRPLIAHNSIWRPSLTIST